MKEFEKAVQVVAGTRANERLPRYLTAIDHLIAFATQNNRVQAPAIPSRAYESLRRRGAMRLQRLHRGALEANLAGLSPKSVAKDACDSVLEELGGMPTVNL